MFRSLEIIFCSMSSSELDGNIGIQLIDLFKGVTIPSIHLDSFGKIVIPENISVQVHFCISPSHFGIFLIVCRTFVCGVAID